MTDAEYNAWLADERNERCLLVDIEYRSAGGSTVSDYLSTHPFVTEPGDTPANTAYRNAITKIPEFTQEMTDVLLGRTTASGGTVTVDNSGGELDAWITANFSGRPVTIYLGSPSWPKADFRSVWVGVLSEITVSGTNAINLGIRARDHLLSQNLMTTKITTGESAGKYKPLLYGKCYNVPALLYDAATKKYMVNAADVYTIHDVRIDGISVGAGFTDNGDGTFTITGNVGTISGAVTADVSGMYSGGTLFEKIKEIVKDICVTRGPFVEADFENTNSEWTNLNTTFAQKIGLYITEPTQYYTLLDDICASVGATYSVTRDGTILIRKFQLSGTATLELGVHQMPAHGLGITRIYQPMDNLVRGYERKWTTQSLAAPDVTLNLTFDTTYITEVAFANGYYDGNTRYAYSKHTPTTRELYGNEYKWVTSTNAGAANLLKTKDPEPQGTLLTLSTDCQTEADRWIGIWGSVRVRYSVDCFLDGARVNIGDRVAITHPRYGLSAGATGTVVKIVDRMTKRRQTIEVLM